MLRPDHAATLGAAPTVSTLALLLGVALALGGCASVAPPRPPAATPAQQRTALASTLAIERQWLDSWFRGTPVRIAQRADGVLAIDVPREFCFDHGSTRIKPALGAVLDKAAESLRRRAQLRVLLLAAPEDRAGATPLALQRAQQVQEHLRDRGVAAARLVPPTVAASAAVQLRIGAAGP